jgi:ABC-type glycerol-3-phosphate transport system substrate-binding protein
MKIVRNTLVILLAAAMALSCAACGSSGATTAASATDAYAQDNQALTFNSAIWNYDADNDVYWQVGVAYCAAPQAPTWRPWASMCPAPT